MRLPFTSKRLWAWRWMVTPTWGVLHRVASGTMDEVTMCPIGVRDGATVCGLHGTFEMPGIFSRMGRARCKHCCRRLGIACGDGAPYNHGIREPTTWRQPKAHRG